ncbi:unnamed protein product [Adineta steineri]|uniref:U-box domain-containing protein n=1 Tax=Adineta steineri TaxID=433720 RepID=A0A815E399_9BILA|nr:unnamed protein product [Adineta steineri]CAF3679021.1 unnamed protein product [Adineta steineri]
MVHELPTPAPTQPLTPVEVLASNTASLPPNQIHTFMEAYECAKNDYHWNKVISAISEHPDWLTRIPQGRRWTMLHQIVYCGNVPRFNEILSYEISNQDFRLLHKALDDKTIREVASERAHIHPQMLRRIERLVAMDQILNNARDGKWELVKQFLRQQTDIVNEKPPYRKYYLAHFLALTGQFNIFKDLCNICEFKLDLIADGKTINQIAREHNHIEFAEYIENHMPNADAISETNSDNNSILSVTIDDSHLPLATTQPYFSQGFHDDPGIMIFSLNSTTNSFGDVLLSVNEPILISNHDQDSSHDQLYTHSLIHGQNSVNDHNNNNDEEKNNQKLKLTVSPSMTEEEQMEYERIVTENIKRFSADNLLNSAVTCCITKGILRDPVVAADGFTYEREAILNWFKQSNRSPMTNQELENQEVKPNHAIKSILKSLAELNHDAKISDKKAEITDENIN